MRTKAIFLPIITSILMFTFFSCSGIKLDDNCQKQDKIVFTVFPFTNDDYLCHKNIEQKLQDMCYEIVDGTMLLNELKHSINKELTEISADELANFAKTKGIDKLVFGNIEVVWFEGHKPLTRTDSDIITTLAMGGKVLQETLIHENIDMKHEVYQNITGNYAVADCFVIETNSGQKTKLFNKYKVKKVKTGMPGLTQNTAN